MLDSSSIILLTVTAFVLFPNVGVLTIFPLIILAVSFSND